MKWRLVIGNAPTRCVRGAQANSIAGGPPRFSSHAICARSMAWILLKASSILHTVLDTSCDDRDNERSSPSFNRSQREPAR